MLCSDFWIKMAQVNSDVMTSSICLYTKPTSCIILCRQPRPYASCARCRSVDGRVEPDAGRVDYLSWSRSVKLEAIPLVVQHCRTVGPLSLSVLNSHELQLLQNMLGRLCKVAQAAAEVRMRPLLPMPGAGS